MTSRERVAIAINHEEPDRIPLLLGVTTSTTLNIVAYERLKRYLGVDTPTVILSKDAQLARIDEKILEILHVDTRPLFGQPPKYWKDVEVPAKEGRCYIDEWGVKLYKRKDGLYYNIIEFPLKNADIKDIYKCRWPDPRDPGRIEGVEERARELHEQTDFAIVGSPGGHVKIFEQSWFLRGFEQLLSDMLLNPKFAHALFRKVTELHKAKMDEFLKVAGKYLDIVRVADDLGAEDAPLISPRLYREILKPYHKEFFKFIKERTDAKLFFHSDGNIYSLLPDLIEIGVDIIEPVQPVSEEMAPEKLKQEFGHKLCFCTGVDPQHKMPYMRPNAIDSEVKKIVQIFAPGGGFILGPINDIQPDVPPENIVAMYEAGRKYGRYPVAI